MPRKMMRRQVPWSSPQSSLKVFDAATSQQRKMLSSDDAFRAIDAMQSLPDAPRGKAVREQQLAAERSQAHRRARRAKAKANQALPPPVEMTVGGASSSTDTFKS